MLRLAAGELERVLLEQLVFRLQLRSLLELDRQLLLRQPLGFTRSTEFGPPIRGGLYV